MTKVVFFLFLIFQTNTQSQYQNDFHINYGTAVVALLTDNEIAIAADSREISYTFDSFGREFVNIHDDVCKIVIYKNLIFTAANFRSTSLINFNIYEIAEKCLNSDLTFDEKLRSIDKEISLKLVPIYGLMKDMSLDFQRFSVNIQMIFAGFLEDSLFMEARMITVDEESYNVNRSKVQSVNFNYKGEACIVMLGSLERYGKIIKSEFAHLENKPIEYVTTAVEYAKRDPKVGGMIDILRITNLGIDWVQVKENCE